MSFILKDLCGRKSKAHLCQTSEKEGYVMMNQYIILSKSSGKFPKFFFTIVAVYQPQL